MSGAWKPTYGTENSPPVEELDSVRENHTQPALTIRMATDKSIHFLDDNMIIGLTRAMAFNISWETITINLRIIYSQRTLKVTILFLFSSSLHPSYLDKQLINVMLLI